MRTLNMYYRICVYLTIALAICHPTLQISATHTLSIQKNSETKILQGSLENGLTFALVPSTQLKGGTWIKMDCTIPQDEENRDISMLMQHAPFYGTKQYNREDLAQRFNDLGMEIV